jgi:hypothetical protein
VAEQVSIRPNTAAGAADFRVRTDVLAELPARGELVMRDAKASVTAPFTPRQRQGYPLIEKYGGTVVGKKGGDRYPAGTKIPPGTRLEVVRPEDLLRDSQ